MQKNLCFSGIALLLLAHTLCAQTTPPQWYHLPGPFGGDVRQLDTDGDQLYALTTGGIYQSPDAGAHWTLLEPTLKIAHQARQFQVEKGMIYLLTTDGLVLRSGNAGADWTTVLQPPYPYTGPGEQLLKLFAAGDTVLVGSILSIYRSVDQGKSWQPSEVFFKQGFVGFSKINSDLYAAFDRFIQKSTDGGLNWNTVYSSSYFFGAVTAVDTVLYGIYDGYPRVIRSRDGGKKWDKIDSDSIWVGPYPNDFPDWLAGNGQHLYYAADYGCVHGDILVQHSDNEAANWTGRDNNLVLNENWIQDVMALPEGLLIAGRNGISRSTDLGHTFSTVHDGMNAAVILQIFKTNSGQWWTETPSGIYSSADAGNTWTLWVTKDVIMNCGNDWTKLLNQTNQRVFAQDCAIIYTEDGGNSWDTLATGMPYDCPLITTSQHTAFLADRHGLFRFDDGQDMLVPLNSPIASPYFGMTFSFNQGVLYFGGYFSKDEGLTWDSIPRYDENDSNYYWLLSRLLEDPMFDYWGVQKLYVSDSSYLVEHFISRYNLSTHVWERYDLIDPVFGDTVSPLMIRLFTRNGPLYWLGLEGRGLYYSSTAEADDWHPYSPEFPATSPSAICLAGDDLWVGTAGYGIFRTKLEFRTPDGPAPQLALYPNPSTGDGLQLHSDLFFSEPLRLRLFDAAGRLLQDRALPPGQHWTLDPPGVPAGVYLFQFLEGGRQATTLRWVKG